MLSVLLICMGIAFETANSSVTGNTQDFAVRLNNSFGNSSKEGRLEIYYSGSWGTVCDDYFTNESAGVACASLGFAYIGAVIRNRHGAGTDPIWLDNVNCTGTESGLEQCAHTGWGVDDCSHREDVSISCECGVRYFSGPTGGILSPNFPLAYANSLDCYNYITVPSGQTIIITFLAFNTESTHDWVMITCASGNVFRSPRYMGVELPPVLTITSCNLVNVSFHTDGSSTRTGFSLTYNIISDTVIKGFTTKPSNAFPRSDKDDLVIFNCTSSTKYLPWWTVNAKRSSQTAIYRQCFGIDYGSPINYTITNSTCGVITSAPYSSWFKTETLGPGSCNLIVIAPANDLYLLEGCFVCTDSTLSSARAILAPINLELRLTKGMNSLATVTDIIRDEEIRISCNPSFTDGYSFYSSSSLVFTYSLYSGGPVVRMRILRTYWTSQGKIISSNETSNTSSYVLVKAPKDGLFPRYTCNIVCDFFSNISDVKFNSPMSFSNEPVEVSYWPTKDNMRIIGDNNGQIRIPAWLYCNVAANPPATYTWIDESNGNITNGPTIVVNHGGKYTCNASNIIREQYYQQSKSVNLQVVEDDTDRLKLLATILGALLGAAVLSISILSAILLSIKHRQQKTNTAADVGHAFDGNEHELRQRGGEDNLYANDFGNAAEVDETEYDTLETSHRRLPTETAVYQELKIKK